MLLEGLHLENFKNYTSCSFSFGPKLNFIYGENGNGKTNILEAISLLCFSKSFLLNSENDCVKYSETRFDVTGTFENRVGTKHKLRFSYDKGSACKEMIFDSEKISRFSGFIGKFPLVVLSPQDLRLTLGTPQDRRRNFDLLLSQISMVYLDDLKKYNRTLKQKNSLLKDNLITRKYSRTEIMDFIELWNRELVQYGIKILIRRLDFLEEFKKYLETSFFNIVGNKYLPLIAYESEMLPHTGSPLADVDIIRDNFTSLIDSKMDAEIKRGTSLCGPHRDNYVFSMEKSGELFDMRTFASQGEHKTFVVSLKFSEYSYIKESVNHTNTGEPILLLDDVFSELDRNRVGKICSLISGYKQVFLTTTEKSYLSELKKDFSEARTFEVINGTASLVN
jgi:DNA replication and repair protein RecF